MASHKAPTRAKATPTINTQITPDSIAKNRAIAVLEAEKIPKPPPGFEPTDPATLNRKLRRLATQLRPIALGALQEASERDLRAELGKYAPEPKQAILLASRLSKTGQLVAAAQTLLSYAKEIDQIALSDALVYLESEQRQFLNATAHEPNLKKLYPMLCQLFASRAEAISEGLAKAKEKNTTKE